MVIDRDDDMPEGGGIKSYRPVDVRRRQISQPPICKVLIQEV
jgi:hypothetical protein